MNDGNPITGQPYGGKNEPSGDSSVPGTYGEGGVVQPPDDPGEGGDNASRAAVDGPMASDPPGEMRGSEGIPQQVAAPSPGDATDAEPPGGSVANQTGRAPDQ